jgi:hypothetical protein
MNQISVYGKLTTELKSLGDLDSPSGLGFDVNVAYLVNLGGWSKFLSINSI